MSGISGEYNATFDSNPRDIINGKKERIEWFKSLINKFSERKTRFKGENQNYSVVYPGEIFVGDIPTISVGYAYCRAAVISDGKRIGLSHIVPREPPMKTIEHMLNEINKPVDELKMIIISTDSFYEKRLEECCAEKGLRVVNTYYEKSDEFGVTIRHVAADPINQFAYVITRGHRETILEF